MIRKGSFLVLFIAGCGVSSPDLDRARQIYSACLGEELGNLQFSETEEGLERERALASFNAENGLRVLVMGTKAQRRLRIDDRLRSLLARAPLNQRASLTNEFEQARVRTFEAERSAEPWQLSVRTITEVDCYKKIEFLSSNGALD